MSVAEIIPYDEATDDLGPKMLALTLRQRKFVRVLIALGLRGKATAAVKIAGYGGPRATHNSAKQQAFWLTHNAKVQEAIHEECFKLLAAGKFVAITGLMRIAADPDHPKNFDALRDIADRSGFAAKTEHKVTVERVENSGEQVERLVRLAQALNLDPKALLGRYGVALPDEPAQIEGPDERA